MERDFSSSEVKNVDIVVSTEIAYVAEARTVKRQGEKLQLLKYF